MVLIKFGFDEINKKSLKYQNVNVYFGLTECIFIYLRQLDTL